MGRPIEPTSRRRIVVGGFLGLFPAGGVTWDYVQYPLGFHLLGHDVWYVEDTGLWPVFGSDTGDDGDCAATVAHLAAAMDAFGLGDRWAYRDEVTGRWYGKSAEQVDRFVRSADVFVNVSCSSPLREHHMEIPSRVLVDTDPMFTQVQYLEQIAFTPGESELRELVDGHTHHFSFGELIGSPDCLVPTCGIAWRPTRQPICLDWWPVTAPVVGAPITTVMNWSATAPMEFGGRSWHQKDVELQRIIGLPGRLPDVAFTLAITMEPSERARSSARELAEAGWNLVSATETVPDHISYQDFIGRSAAEISIAKHTYVAARTGWFSCRSACYLASGRPVVAQDTGWSRGIATGAGLFAYATIDDAAAAIDAIRTAPDAHAAAARAVGAAEFDSGLVLAAMLDEVA